MAFEGLVGVGKTTAIGRLRRRCPGVGYVPEIVDPHVVAQLASGHGRPADADFARNDHRKSDVARALGAAGPVLVDRYIFSTVACDLALSGGPVQGQERRLVDDMLGNYGSAVWPDTVVFIHAPPLQAWDWAKARCPDRLEGPWSSLRMFQRIDEAYALLLELTRSNGLATVNVVAAEEVAFSADRVSAALANLLAPPEASRAGAAPTVRAVLSGLA